MTTIKINNISLNYTESGKSNARTIVFAHPLLWGAEMFDELLTDLAQDFHVVSVDVHGHANSGYRTPLTIDEMTDDFSIMLEKLELSKVVWFGISIGGIIGMRLALKYPEKLDALILMATTSHLDAPEIKAQTRNLWELFRAGERESLVKPAMPFFFAKRTFAEKPELIERFSRALVDVKEVKGMFEAANAYFERDDIGDAISAIKIPTLVVAGDEDVTATAPEAEFMTSQIPNAQLKIFADANHLLAVEYPNEAAKTIREFLLKGDSAGKYN